MSGYYPDDHPAFDIPYFNPELVEEECFPAFPVVHDIEYIGGIRVSRAIYFKNGRSTLGWACEHGQCALTPEEAAADCMTYCGEEIHA